MRTDRAEIGAVLTLVVCVFCGCHAHLASTPGPGTPSTALAYQSKYGYGVHLPDGWTAISGKADVEALRQDPAVSRWDPAIVDAAIERFRTGVYDFFVRRAPCDETFVTILAHRREIALPKTETELQRGCANLPATLSRAAGRSVAVALCEPRFVGAQGKMALYIEADGAKPGLVALQYLVEQTERAAIAFLATTDRRCVDSTRRDFDSMMATASFANDGP